MKNRDCKFKIKKFKWKELTQDKLSNYTFRFERSIKIKPGIIFRDKEN